jgi:hypothetical protein
MNILHKIQNNPLHLALDRYNPPLRLYNFYSFWIFIWVLLFKLGFIKSDPTISVIFVIIGIIYLIIINYKSMINFEYINYKLLKIQIILLILIDLFPMYLMYPYKLDCKTLNINIIILLIYILYMCIIKINIINMYAYYINISKIKI